MNRLKVGEYIILDFNGKIVKGFGSFKSYMYAVEALQIWLGDAYSDLGSTYQIVENY